MIVVWLNGQIVDDSKTPSAVTAPGLLVGEGLFETLAVYDGTPFALAEHFERLAASSAALGFAGLSLDELKEGIDLAITADLAHDPVRRLRVTVWHSGIEAEPVSRSVLVMPGVGPQLGQTNSSTAAVSSSNFVRNERSALTGHKSTSYAENIYALRAAQALGSNEAILFNSVGDLSEGSMTNIVVQLGNELVTPALSSGCLPGVTRRLALEWSRNAGLPLREAEPGELTRKIVGNPTALLGTLRNVQHVAQWDGINLERGALLTELAQLFATQMKLC